MIRMFAHLVWGCILLCAVSTSPSAEAKTTMAITVHIQGMGDVRGTDNEWVGTRGQSRRLELFKIVPKGMPAGLRMQYKCHLQGMGTTPWKDAGSECGTRGESRRLEGFRIRLVGSQAEQYDIIYQCHVQGRGDGRLYMNGQYCGTTGQRKRVEAMHVRLLRRGKR